MAGRSGSLASRTNFDLTQHANASGKVLDYYDDEAKEHYVPYVIEPPSASTVPARFHVRCLF